MSQPTPSSPSIRDHLPAVYMLLVWLGLAIHTCGAMSVTTDESWHWPVGMRNLVDGDFAADRLNPPLARMWAAIPGALAGVKVSAGSGHDAIGDQFIAEHPDFFRWYVWGRYFNLVWALVTGIAVYEVLRRWKGLAAARWGLLAFLCVPDVVAHASLVTPDSAAMAWFFLTSLAAALWLDQASSKRSVMLGIALGAMMATKYTGVVFLPVIGLLGIARVLSIRGGTWKQIRWGWGAGQVALVGVVSLLTIAAAYRFHGLFEPLAGYTFQSGDMRTIQNLAGPLAQLPLPVPRDLVLGIDIQRQIMEGAHPTFLDGHWSVEGFKSYFVLAAAYKLPLAILALSMIGLVCVLRDRQSSRITRWALVMPAGLLFTIASFSSMQLGFRYIMPVVPLLACASGAAMGGIQRWPGSLRWSTGIVMAAALLTSWRYHPHHLSYFNELAGGPIGGRQHLLDSNLDWGQDLHRAKAVADRFPNEPLWIAYFGHIDPRTVGIHSQGPPPKRILPGLYLVSVNFVMGRPGMVCEADGQVRAVDFNEFGGFRQLTPVEHVGYSIDLYRISESDLTGNSGR